MPRQSKGLRAGSSLRAIARAILLISFATQALYIAKHWWEFDSRLSCDRLLYWGEWIACLHGRSHVYVGDIEVAVGVWFVAAVSLVLGTFVRAYVSAIIPLIAFLVFCLSIVGLWHNTVLPLEPYGQPRSEDIHAFAISAGIFAVYLVGPVLGAWLLALDGRAEPISLRVPIGD